MLTRAFVTGGAGFLGRHLVQRLVQDGLHVTVYDRHPRPAYFPAVVGYVQENVLDRVFLTRALREDQPSIVFHLAALADVRASLPHALQQAQQNLVATGYVLEAMRQAGVTDIAFSSSAVVYGDQHGRLNETQTAGQQTSVYGAMKLASEALIQAYCVGYGWRADIFRFVSVLGDGYKHGNLADFHAKLTADPTTIHVLGSGHEQKYYVDAADAVDAMMRAVRSDHTGSETWNVSADDPCTISDNVDIMCDCMNIHPVCNYEGHRWAGDLPSLVLDTSKIRALGWAPTISTTEAIRRTVQFLMTHQKQPV